MTKSYSSTRRFALPAVAAVLALILTAISATPAMADGWHRYHGWGHGWYGGPSISFYGGPGYYYAPPPAYYYPPPAYYPPPQPYYAPAPAYYGPAIGLGLSFHVR